MPLQLSMKYQSDDEEGFFYSSKHDLHYIDVTEECLLDNMTTETKDVVSLFSGAGGLDIGLELAGFETAVCVEIDSNCRETLRYNRSKWKLFDDGTDRTPGDVRSIRAEELLEFIGRKRGEPWLVVGGAPCQPFSNIGKKEGQNDVRNGDLFLEFVRLVTGILPRSFIFENVSGITQKKHSDVLLKMTECFRKIGYTVSGAILNAANYGVAQKRERFILLGIRNSYKVAFPLPTHMRNDRSWNEFVDCLDNNPSYSPSRWVTVEEALAHIPKSIDKREDCVVMNVSEKIRERMKHIKQGQNFKVLPISMLPNCWKSGKHQGQDTFGRMELSSPAPTIRTAAYNPTKGKYIHPIENRGLNIHELAAFQGFPSSWVFKSRGRDRVTLVSAGKQIGNAVPPLLGRAIGLAVKKQLFQLRIRPKARSRSFKEFALKTASTAASGVV